MTSREYVLDAMRRQGLAAARVLQEKASGMTGTELNDQDNWLPDFREARANGNMLNRKAGQTDGFVCKTSAGRVVRLIQSYDSDVFTGEPEELPAQWRFVWSTDPKKAKPFIASSTSYYNTGDCCLNAAGEPRRSKIDANVYDPDASPEFWKDP